MSSLENFLYNTHISRKKALIVSGMGIANLVFRGQTIPAVLAETNTEIIASQLQQEIEKTYGIELTTENILLAELGQPAQLDSDTDTEWTIKRLNNLVSVLDILPSSFYAQKWDKPVRFELSSDNWNDFCPTPNGDSWQQDPARQAHLRLNNNVMNTETTSTTTRSFYEMVTHELIHANTPFGNGDDWDTNICPWYADIDTSLGQSFQETKGNLLQILNKIDSNTDSSPETRKRIYNDSMLAYGLEPELSYEFIAVMGENYIKGSDEFYSIYSAILPDNIIANLYAFTRDKLFGGNIFKNLKMVTTTN